MLWGMTLRSSGGIWTGARQEGRERKGRERMIECKVVRERTGLTSGQLMYMRELGLLPRATRVRTKGQRGSSAFYPDTIFTRIRVIRFLQGHGGSLAQISRAARGTPFECLDRSPSVWERG
ncbi:hypothetical protein ES708_33084 [subsurface metagenome]